MAPPAPSPCPVMPLVEVTGGEDAPNTLVMASASAWSLSGVEVPWALMWPICSGVTAASSMARIMQAAAPEPPGIGAVM